MVLTWRVEVSAAKLLALLSPSHPGNASAHLAAAAHTAPHLGGGGEGEGGGGLGLGGGGLGLGGGGEGEGGGGLGLRVMRNAWGWDSPYLDNVATFPGPSWASCPPASNAFQNIPRRNNPTPIPGRRRRG